MPKPFPLTKGYLPVRVKLPGWSGEPDETFFFIKEHNGAGGDQQAGSTLFVANVPIVPGVQSQLVLRSLLGRYGDIERVTVVENPRLKKQLSLGVSPSWLMFPSKPSFLDPVRSQGRFAHVVFTSAKEMKRAFHSMGEVMAGGPESPGGLLPGLTLEKLEIQTLQDATDRRSRHEGDEGNVDDRQDDIQPSDGSTLAILTVSERYRKSCLAMLSRVDLLKECNRAMEAYEDAEERDRRKRDHAKSQPDEEGFITVTYATQSVGSKRELEQSGEQHRKHGTKRSRKKKQNGDDGGLTDFYRFQTKQTRKKGLHNLRKKFEEDLAKVKKLKEERQYKPF